MKSAIDWIQDEPPSPTKTPTTATGCPATCLEHEVFYRQLSEIALRNLAFEEEILSHLSAMHEMSRREQKARDIRANVIIDRLDKIEEKISHVTNGGLKDAMQEVVPLILKTIGANQAENTKGRWAARTAAISGAFAVLGGITTWLITRFL